MKSNAAYVGRHYTRDNLMTFDASFLTTDQFGNQRGKPIGTCITHDGRTVDSTGAFLVGELERLDLTLHEPLVSTQYLRDIMLREDVTIADEVSSFTVSTYGSAGGTGNGNGIGNGKAWVGKVSDQIGGVGVDIAKTPQPLRPWALELKYSIMELESSARVGRPIDQQKYDALKLKHQMDTDEQVYMGDTTTGDTGLVNSAKVTNVSNVAAGQLGSPLWTQKTPPEILADFNTALTSVWAASAWAVMPQRVLIPPAQFGYISTQLISSAGNQSILKYVLENNLLTKAGGGAGLEILPSKWCIGAGAGGTIGTVGIDRMVVYTKNKEYSRFPMTMLQKTPIQYESIYHKTTYYGRLGVVEVVYPETHGYFDGI